MKENTSTRLKRIMEERNLKQVDIIKMCEPYCEKYNVKLDKNYLSQYVSGRVEPGQRTLSILAMALNVNEPWLMGFDVPMERNSIPQSDESPVVKAIINSGDTDSELFNEILMRKTNTKINFESIEFSLLSEFKKLNATGKMEAVNRVKELAYVPQYTDSNVIPIQYKKKPIITEEDINSLVARNGKKFTREEAIQFLTDLYAENETDD